MSTGLSLQRVILEKHQAVMNGDTNVYSYYKGVSSEFTFETNHKRQSRAPRHRLRVFFGNLDDCVPVSSPSLKDLHHELELCENFGLLKDGIGTCICGCTLLRQGFVFIGPSGRKGYVGTSCVNYFPRLLDSLNKRYDTGDCEQCDNKCGLSQISRLCTGERVCHYCYKKTTLGKNDPKLMKPVVQVLPPVDLFEEAQLYNEKEERRRAYEAQMRESTLAGIRLREERLAREARETVRLRIENDRLGKVQQRRMTALSVSTHFKKILVGAFVKQPALQLLAYRDKLGSYAPDFGKYKGTRISAIPRKQLDEYACWLCDNSIPRYADGMLMKEYLALLRMSKAECIARAKVLQGKRMASNMYLRIIE